MVKKIERLTKEQTNKFSQYVDEWLNIGLSTEPVNKAMTEKYVKEAYKNVGLNTTNLEFEYRCSPEKKHIKAIMWNNLNAPVFSYYSFMKREVGVKNISKIDCFLELTKYCGPIALYDTKVIVYERPVEIKMDEQNRLHSETGPAILYRDGFSVYSWHGVRIPKEWIEDSPPSPEDALRWENLEQRRVACEIIGWDNILNLLNAKIIDEDKDPMIGTLVEVDIPDIGRERFIRVLCGTGRSFALPVPPEMTTALEANAWTYDLDGDILRKLEVRT